MSRSLNKGPYIDPKLVEKIKANPAKDKVIKSWARSSSISPDMVGYTIGVHNGREHVPIRITEEMVGHKLGEFSFTRKFLRHGGRIAREEEEEERTSANRAKSQLREEDE